MNWQELVVYIILVLCFMTIILKHKFWKKLVFTKKQATEKVYCPNACPGCKCGSACSAAPDNVDLTKKISSCH